MLKPLIKISILLYEFIRSFVLVLVQFFTWTLSHWLSATIMVILLVAVLSWAGGFIVFVDDISQTRDDIIRANPEINERTDAIVVLTGGSERIRYAINLLNIGFADKLFISGVNREVKLSELLYYNGYKGQTQLSNRIELGYSAFDTIQNADEIAYWVRSNNIKSIRLVTSNYHIKRAMLEIQHRLPDIKIIPHSVLPINIRIDRWWEFKSTRDLLISEYNKYLLANIRIFVEDLGF